MSKPITFIPERPAPRHAAPPREPEPTPPPQSRPAPAASPAWEPPAAQEADTSRSSRSTRPSRPKRTKRAPQAPSFGSPTAAADYGQPSGTRTILLVGAIVAVVFLGWLAWAAWFHSTPVVRSALTGYELNGDHLAIAHVDVKLTPGVAADCIVQAIAEDHSVVGIQHFSPVDGANTVQVATERAATTIQLVGCTAKGQDQPQ